MSQVKVRIYADSNTSSKTLEGLQGENKKTDKTQQLECTPSYSILIPVVTIMSYNTRLCRRREGGGQNKIFS